MRGVGPRLGDYGGRARVPSGAGILPKRGKKTIFASFSVSNASSEGLNKGYVFPIFARA